MKNRKLKRNNKTNPGPNPITDPNLRLVGWRVVGQINEVNERQVRFG